MNRIACLGFLVASAIPALASAEPAVPPNLGVISANDGLAIGSTTLFKGPVSAVVYDAKQDLIWFVSKGSLEVIDLRDAARKPVVIATKLPTDSFSISGFAEAHSGDDYTDVFIHFDFGKKPVATAEDGLYAEVDPDGAAKTKKKVKKVSIVGKKWIAAQQGRTANPEPAKRPDPAHVTLPQSFLSECEDTSICGTAQWMGASPYQTVIVNHSCGDACHVSCALYDPAKKVFASPAADGGWGPLDDKITPGECGFDVEPGNARYIGGGKICTLGAKMTCTDLGNWGGFAWITTTPAKP